MAAQHSGLSAERISRFSRGQQLMAIANAQAFRALLQLHPETWRQLPYVTGAAV
jgi:hypothetical protein